MALLILLTFVFVMHLAIMNTLEDEYNINSRYIKLLHVCFVISIIGFWLFLKYGTTDKTSNIQSEIITPKVDQYKKKKTVHHIDEDSENQIFIDEDGNYIDKDGEIIDLGDYSELDFDENELYRK